MASPDRELLAGLDRYFAPFISTAALVSELIARRKHATEVLILLCARLDALALDAASGEQVSGAQALRRFLKAYSGEEEFFESVSVGDLYYELGYHRWLLDGLLPEPGRLFRFGKLNDPVLHLLVDAGLPLTKEKSTLLLSTVIRLLERRYHVRPRQSASKARFVHPAKLKGEIKVAAEHTRLKPVADTLPKALEPLLDAKRISALLYQRFRCESIHGAKVILDENRFFVERDVYWSRLCSEYYGCFELIEFSAPYLLRCLKTCIENFRNHLSRKGSLPSGVHFHAFDAAPLSTLHLLDRESLSEGGKVGFKFG